MFKKEISNALNCLADSLRSGGMEVQIAPSENVLLTGEIKRHVTKAEIEELAAFSDALKLFTYCGLESCLMRLHLRSEFNENGDVINRAIAIFEADDSACDIPLIKTAAQVFGVSSNPENPEELFRSVIAEDTYVIELVDTKEGYEAVAVGYFNSIYKVFSALAQDEAESPKP